MAKRQYPHYGKAIASTVHVKANEAKMKGGPAQTTQGNAPSNAEEHSEEGLKQRTGGHSKMR
jgi:hypothetical protein